MKAEDLVIGKEYWFDSSKKDKGIYIGIRKFTGGIYFEPIGETSYFKSISNDDFKGKIGFINGSNGLNPVE